jgi:hypothetical protein
VQVRQPAGRARERALSRDIGALRRWIWVPITSVVVAVVMALAVAPLQGAPSDARFRMNVVVDALPPLFGPAVVPSPFDYARLATSDGVVGDVASRTGTQVQDLRPRMTAEARLDRPDIEFRVTGDGALAIARAWQESFASAASASTPDIERLLVQPYARQLDEARAQLVAAQAAADAAPDNATAQAELTAAKDNFETASRLSQSYEVVARTMRAQAFTLASPRTSSARLGSTLGRTAAAIAVGLIAGIAGALALDYAARRRAPTEAREPIDARPAFRSRAQRRRESTQG